MCFLYCLRKRKMGSWIQMLIDGLVLASVATPLFFLEFLIKPFHRGFFCDDESIKYPFKNSTISAAVMFTVSIGLPIISMLLGEALIYCRGSGHKSHQMCSREVHPFVWSCYKVIGVFLFGALVCQLLTDCCKYSIGRLRPHFISVCKPEFSALNCSTADDLMRYIVDYTCMGDAKLVHEARLSFLSGHASYSMYCMMYLAIYIQARMQWNRSRLLKPFLQLVVITMALLTGLSRISDYKHHWSDVLAGLSLGAAVALVVSALVSDLFKDRHIYTLPGNDYKKSDDYGSSAQVPPVKGSNLEEVEIK
ncbi:phospholipid phosphatase 1 isoform X2 [Lingula anatina]|uniref:Phospholipid phosphatase 1 isoform X2 n=1 Tax=Lingula anatina TaxID=7574 RepID=A0A1S3JAR4_LINAN|nr:phospholipid phosphatase 1 isoform X2 [Lingula anatina]|eukprot:XP_013407286.1 phospholipid phosphatase 1 isoform X2 [Lingula anatina]